MHIHLKPHKQRMFILLFLWFLFMGNLFGQNNTQTIRGTVSDVNHHSLEGVTIYLPKLEKGTTTDEAGKFRLEEIPVGRYQLRVSYVGFETLILTEVFVQSGREEVLEIFLKEAISEIQEVVVKSTVRDPRRTALAPEILTIEETLRMPSTFYDPARLTFAYAGVANTNDQANNMTIRGNTPNSMSWRLEGVEIVNPNHLTGAGTFADRTTQNGGGVNILSAQMLGTSTFYRGSFPSNYGNVLSGIMDMRLRKGNNEQLEFTGQIGLIGLDIAAEGPLKREAGSSFLVNYRYSTLGLLSAMGVDLSDEVITFQDLSLHLNFPLKKGGELSFFAISGLSENTFEGPRQDSLRLVEKDKYDIFYTSEMAALGGTYFQSFGNNLFWENTIVYSRSNYLREQFRVFLSNSSPNELRISDDLEQAKLSIHSNIKYRLNSKSRITAGIQLVNMMDEMNFENFLFSENANGKVDGALIQPYVDWNARFSNINFTIGLRSNYFYYNKTNAIEPRFSLGYHISPKQKLGLSYGLNSQLQLPQVYSFSPSGNELPNKELAATKAHHISFAYENQIKDKISFRTEMYFQSLFDVPVSATGSNAFSALNLLNETVNDTLVNEGTGTNYGIEFSVQQYFSNNVFWLANASLYESKYKGSDGIERDTRFNGNYIINLSGGKEFLWSKKEKDLVLGVNARLAFLGGFRETPINTIASDEAGTTIFQDDKAFSIKKKNYFRPDLRIYFTRNKKKYSSTLALDIQNVSNQQNVSFEYFDSFKEEIVRNYQLGIIPILNYRIEF